MPADLDAVEMVKKLRKSIGGDVVEAGFLLDDAATLIASLAEENERLTRERNEAREDAGLGCDAAGGGAHTLMAQGREHFCVKCGYMIKAPSIHERARRAEARALTAEAALAKAVVDEREACARAADVHGEFTSNEPSAKACARNIARKIRARTTGGTDAQG